MAKVCIHTIKLTRMITISQNKALFIELSFILVSDYAQTQIGIASSH